MADVEVNLKNTNPKELYAQGVRAYLIQDYDTAVQALSKASELLSAEHQDESHDSLAEVYLYYGKSLLEYARKESGPLGDGVLKNIAESSDCEGSESDPIEFVEDRQAEVGEDAEMAEVAASIPYDGKSADTKSENGQKEEADSSEKVETDGKCENGVEGTADDAEGDATDLQVAWEVLEVAKTIFTARGEKGEKFLADTLVVLGEISLESGNYASAVEDITLGLTLQKTLFTDDNRTVAETYFKLGGALSTNGQVNEAIASYEESLNYLKRKLDNLTKNQEKLEENNEILEIKALIPELEEKIGDMKNIIEELKNKGKESVNEAEPSENRGESSSSSSKQVNNISHLVKRKRKSEDDAEGHEAKKPSP